MENNNIKYTSDIAFTPAVKTIQEKHNSRKGYERMEQSGAWQNEVTNELSQFLSSMDSFYLGTSNSFGQPYIQHRGGPKGFLKVLDKNRLAFADFRGNKQYISIGNLSENKQAFIFLMDYRNQTRIKIWGTAEVIEDDKELLESLSDPSYYARLERVIVFKVKAWDVNCRQHIKQRYSQEEVMSLIDPLNKEIAELQMTLQQHSIKF